MKILPGRFLLLLTTSTFFFCSESLAFAATHRDERQVRLNFVQGDVRLSRGNGNHTDLNKSWEQAQEGTLMEQGFALATGNGRVEIEFEYGSTVFLAENSLLLFPELSAPDERLTTRIALPTGTATFALQPTAGESFFIETPTDRIEISAPDTYFGRIDAYLDATAITPQGEKGESIVRRDVPKLSIPKGQTVFFQGGEVVEFYNGAPRNFDDVVQNLHVLFDLQQQELARDLNAPELVPQVSQTLDRFTDAITNRSQATAEWDDWTSARVQERAATTVAALKASGLSSPPPGLHDLYARGSFFDCQPYGTCWEPNQQEPPQATNPQSSPPPAQSSSPNTGFQPQTVEWTQTNWGDCGLYSSKRISFVARTPEELNQLLRRKAQDERGALRGAAYSTSCETGLWIPYRHHYARVLTPPIPPRCPGAKCKPVHPPRPTWVRVGSKVGFVPRHPNDVKGKPPINLKNGIIIPPSKPGEPAQRVPLEASQKVKTLDKPPVEFREDRFSHPWPASAPMIRAHLVQEAMHGKSISAADRSSSHIVYDL